ncbi:MAG: stage II sporulation protein D [Oscillospiraceae bacterium]|nr:stage II sporulation protein D [Oscillospiraceae bacterium]
MRPLWKDILTAIVLGLLLPGVLLNGAALYLDTKPGSLIQAKETMPERIALRMYLRDQDGGVAMLDMDTYLVGVVMAEMPASFEMEALKAQSVAARTYTHKAYTTGGKHGDGSVCTDPGCCQAYLTEESYLAKGGSPEGIEKIRSAVCATSGEVLTYEGDLIEATYFSCSGGSTEDAAAVWGTDYPYLRAVSSPGEEAAVYHMDTVTVTPRQFQNALGRELPGPPQTWFGAPSYTAGGGVDSMTIGGEAYTGTQLRSLLDLRSTAFSFSAEADTITITTHGYGHRVGMSQYGADAMAVAGSTYQKILTHYYPGTTLTQIQP